MHGMRLGPRKLLKAIYGSGRTRVERSVGSLSDDMMKFALNGMNGTTSSLISESIRRGKGMLEGWVETLVFAEWCRFQLFGEMNYSY